MPVYRYRLTGISLIDLTQAVPGSPTIGSSGPSTYVDITALTTSKSDLDDYMSSQGYAYDSTDPATTPTQKSYSELFLRDMTSPPATPTTDIQVFSKFRAGRHMASQVGPSGVDYTFQPSLLGNKIGWWTATGNGTVVSAINLNNTITGTATTRNVATTSFFTSLRRIGYVSATSAGSSAGTRHGAAQFWRGNANGLGGFLYVARFGISQTQTNYRLFVGLSATTTGLSIS